MRVISGKWKGRGIVSPKGTNTRPTTDRARESVMSSVYSVHGGFCGAVVLDAFAGSGAFGIEALSRGASRCIFFDNDKCAQSAIRSNLDILDISNQQACVYGLNVINFDFTSLSEKFDIVFLDPPYKMSCDAILNFIEKLSDADCLAAGSVICFEHSKDSDIACFEQCSKLGIARVAHKVISASAFEICRKED